MVEQFWGFKMLHSNRNLAEVRAACGMPNTRHTRLQVCTQVVLVLLRVRWERCALTSEILEGVIRVSGSRHRLVRSLIA